MEIFQNMATGFGIAATPVNLLLCLAGCFVGTLIGVLPGIGPAATIALLLPVTFTIPPASAIIMLSGIFYGAMYGGSTTAILVNIPGEAASAITCLEGYQMARRGRAGPALGMAAFGSFIAGTVGVILLMLIAPPVAELALKFGPPEIFAVMVLGLTILSYLSSGSLLKSFIIAIIGLFVGMIGIDIAGIYRFTFGIPDFFDGIGLVPVLMGLFGVAEVLLNLEKVITRDVFDTGLKGLFPTKEDWKVSMLPILRGTGIGFLLGVIPGPSNTISSFVSYAMEKRFSKHPEQFGKGAIEGVAGPESANNSACAGNFIPVLTLGIPTSAVMAVIVGAFIVHGVTPGPLLIKNNPEIFWGTIASMYIGNFMLLVLNLPLIGMWVKVLKIPYGILFPLILLFCFVGAYANNNSLVELNVMIFFGLVGYLMKKTGFEPAPLVMAYVLCPFLEEAFRQSLIKSHGDFSIFFRRPISATILSVSAAFVVINIFGGIRSRRRMLVEKIKDEED
ncbi:MAG TPA: tripartite tricarboxylate transporter permease [Thermodesulfobacteriota bacterium]|nr:tripartite tricarboxylate transporter permease [Thermodesulfobacteriota bacterium]